MSVVTLWCRVDFGKGREFIRNAYANMTDDEKIENNEIIEELENKIDELKEQIIEKDEKIEDMKRDLYQISELHDKMGRYL